MNIADVRGIFERDYKEHIENTCDTTKYEWAASQIFDLCTYDGELDELFVKKIIEICKVILEDRTYEYISESNENYINYILVCQLLYKRDWIDWGTSVRGAWINRWTTASPILSHHYMYKECDEDISFCPEHLKILIDFIEEEEE